MPKPTLRRIIFSALATLFGFAFTFNLVNEYGFTATATSPFNVSVNEMGTQMLSTSEYGYILPFEVVSILLLAAMIGCIVIAMKPPEPKTPALKTITPTTTEIIPVPAALHEVPETIIKEEVTS